MSERSTSAEQSAPSQTSLMNPLRRGELPAGEACAITEVSEQKPGLSLTVRCCSDLAELQRYVEVWQDLADDLLEENVFYLPWMLLPAIREFSADEHWQVLLVVAENERDAELPRLYGLFPVVHDRRFNRIPVGTYHLFDHPHCFLHTPLVRSGFADECFQALFRWLSQARPKAHLLELNHVRGDGPFYQALQSWAARNRRSLFEEECYERALLVPGTSADEYLTETLSHNNYRQLRRCRRRLDELGELRLEVLQPGDDLESWLGDFCQLEGAGWKGEQGTAFANHEQELSYFREICRAASQNGSLMMLRLVLNGTTIASKCNFLVPGGSYAFKIAYDESFSKLSPGAQLELDNVRQVHEQSELKWMDSCAAPHHFMINRLWGQRRTIRSIVLPTRGLTGKMILMLLPTARWIKRKLKQLITRRKTTP